MQIRRFEDVFGYAPTIGKVIEGYDENTKTGSVKAFGGKLEIHPPYQRSFVYELPRQQAVVDTILNHCPLSVMYWAVAPDGSYEMLDGQQRTMSFCKFVRDNFSTPVNLAGKRVPKTFSGLPAELREQVMQYKLLIYICEGDDVDKLMWFRKINTCGIPLTDQEMRNAIYTSPWTVDAKRYFSRIDGEAFSSEGHSTNGHTYGDYLNVTGGSKSEKENAVVRQRLLEIALGWAVDAYNRQFGRNISIDDYMEAHVNEVDAKELWRYYEDVMEWVKKTFPTYRNEMKGVEWGYLYNRYRDTDTTHADDLVNEIFRTAADEISNKKGVYEAVLAKDIKYIHARAFEESDKKWAYNKQAGICPYCHEHYEYNQMQGDHIKPWSCGGVTERANLQMLCTECNGKKSGHDTKFTPFNADVYVPFDLEKWDACGGVDGIEIVD